MATKRISEKASKGKPLTPKEKLRVLTDARAILSDRKHWTQGAFVKVGNDIRNTKKVKVEKGTVQYIPAPQENVAMCVMGAVAASAGIHMDDTLAGPRLAQCSLASVVLEALPASKGVTKTGVFHSFKERLEHGEGLAVETKETEELVEKLDAWYETNGWFHRSKKPKGYPKVTRAVFDRYLEETGMSATELYVQFEEELALESIYSYNDDGKRGHKQIISLLDRAIKSLEAKIS